MDDKDITKEKKICQVEDCNNKHSARGYCGKHYIQMRRDGKIRQILPDTSNIMCVVDGCDSFSYIKGYCSKHHMQICKFGYIIHGRSGTNEVRFDKDLCYLGLYGHNNIINNETIIDKEDYEKVKDYRWCLSGNNYVMTQASSNYLLLHRFLLIAPDGIDVDHINGNTLDNRKNNLRLAKHYQNMANRGKQVNNTSGYKGVYLDKRRNTWNSVLQYKDKHLFLGSFKNKIKAALAYDKKALELLGEFAHTNFMREA